MAICLTDLPLRASPVDAGDHLGSGFESDDSVRRAAYGRRERARRDLAAKGQADQEADAPSAA